MSTNLFPGITGLYYSKYKHEEILGPVFIRKIFNNYHVCVQDSKNKKLYKIVADCQDVNLAERIRDMLIPGYIASK